MTLEEEESNLDTRTPLERIRSTIANIEKFPLPNNERDLVKRVRLYIKAELPIPVELHYVVGSALVALDKVRGKQADTKENIYDLVYEMETQRQHNLRNTGKLGAAAVVDKTNKRNDRTDARKIYEASGKYKKYLLTINKAKEDAYEEFVLLFGYHNKT